jgi:hypothetical protein
MWCAAGPSSSEPSWSSGTSPEGSRARRSRCSSIWAKVVVSCSWRRRNPASRTSAPGSAATSPGECPGNQHRTSAPSAPARTPTHPGSATRRRRTDKHTSNQTTINPSRNAPDRAPHTSPTKCRSAHPRRLARLSGRRTTGTHPAPPTPGGGRAPTSARPCGRRQPSSTASNTSPPGPGSACSSRIFGTSSRFRPNSLPIRVSATSTASPQCVHAAARR